MMKEPEKAHVSDETFDDFLASEDLLAVCEEDAIKEIIADQIRDRKTSFDPMSNMASGAAGLEDLRAR